MICPRCHFELEKQEDVCPECGISLRYSVSGVLKTSTVMIAAGQERAFYPSVEDVPEPLRTTLVASTSSNNSGTIIIANRAGKEQLTQALESEASPQEQKTAAIEDTPESLPSPARQRIRWIAWAGLIFFLLAAAAIFAIWSQRP